jgi:Uma2 family endonuclease
MNLALRKPMTLAEFLNWEERQERKYEFDGTAPVAMVGATHAHSRIQANVTLSVGGRLRGKPCEFHGTELEVAGRIRYPDGFVVCSAVPNDAILVMSEIGIEVPLPEFY